MFIKVAMVVVVATYLDKNRSNMKQFWSIFKLLGICFLPVLLIFMQPDLGTALVYVLILILMLMIGNVNIKYFLGLMVIGLLSISLPMLFTYADMIEAQNESLNEIISGNYLLILIGLFAASTLILFACSVLDAKHFVTECDVFFLLHCCRIDLCFTGTRSTSQAVSKRTSGCFFQSLHIEVGHRVQHHSVSNNDWFWGTVGKRAFSTAHRDS